MTTKRYISLETFYKLNDSHWEKLCIKAGTANIRPHPVPPSKHHVLYLTGDYGMCWGLSDSISLEMTYEELMDSIGDFEEMKFVVHTQEQANILQAWLFEKGYSWKNGRQISNNTFKFFSTTKAGMIRCYSNHKDFGKAVGKRYITKVTVDFVEADTIEINGVTYLKEEVEQALSNINPV